MSLVRKQIYLEPSQDRRVKRWAKAVGVSEAEIIRRSIDLGIERIVEQGVPRHDDAARKLLQAIDGSIAAGHVVGRRQWTRDELYERGGR